MDWDCFLILLKRAWQHQNWRSDEKYALCKQRSVSIPGFKVSESEKSGLGNIHSANWLPNLKKSPPITPKRHLNAAENKAFLREPWRKIPKRRNGRSGFGSFRRQTLYPEVRILSNPATNWRFSNFPISVGYPSKNKNLREEPSSPNRLVLLPSNRASKRWMSFAETAWAGPVSISWSS